MSFNDDVQIDASRERGGLSGGGGRRGPAVAGGGGLVIVIAIIAALMGNPGLAGQLIGGSSTTSQQPQGGGDANAFAHCKTGADADRDVNCRVIATMNSLDVVWAEQAPKLGIQYKKPGLDIFQNYVTTACGQATSKVGPFYCPADETTYFDTSFFEELSTNYGASTGPLAQEFVVAHEVGHHISNQIDTIGLAQKDPQGPESGAVRVELQADCFAGVWAHHAARVPAPGSDKPFLEPLTQQDIADAMSAAAAVGDDRIQEKVQGRVTPENFTHGTAEQRQKWFLTGYEVGDPQACNTFDGDI